MHKERQTNDRCWSENFIIEKFSHTATWLNDICRLENFNLAPQDAGCDDIRQLGNFTLQSNSRMDDIALHRVVVAHSLQRDSGSIFSVR